MTLRVETTVLELPLVLDTGKGTEDVVLEATPDTPGETVLAHLAAHVLGNVATDPRVRCVRTGRSLRPDLPLAAAGLLRGDRLLVGDVARVRAAVDDGRELTPWDLVVVGGPAAGRRLPLAAGELVVGSDAACEVTIDDPALSSRHVLIRVDEEHVEVEDAGSRNGTALDGVSVPAGETRDVAPGSVVRAGRTLIAVERRAAEEIPATVRADGTLAFNRPPRVSPPFEPVPIVLEAPPPEPQRARLPLTASLAPVALGLLLYVVTRQVTMLVFIALTPVMALGSFVEDRRGGKRNFRSKARVFRQRLADLGEELARGRTAEASARRMAAPPTPDLLHRAAARPPTLWERRPTDSDFLLLRLGSAERPSQVRVELQPGGAEALRSEADELVGWYRTIPEVPVTVPLRELGALGLSGPPDRVAGLARSLAFQAATLHSPGELTIVAGVDVDSAPAWSWLKWLPHVRDEAGEERIGVGRIGARSLVEALVRLQEEREEQLSVHVAGAARWPTVLLLLEATAAPERTLIAPLLERGRNVGIMVIWLGAERRELPGECRAIVELDSQTAKLTYIDASSAETIEDVTADSLSRGLALEGARALAPVDDLSAGSAASRIPRRVDLLELLDAPDLDADWIGRRWQAAAEGLGASIGATADGVFRFDLQEDGPHGLVAGTTGAGKSELLQTTIAALAAEHSPTRLTFLLVDYKGGAAFKDCVRLPHTVGFVTDLDEHLTQRALISLNAELRHRESVLRAANAKDLRDFQRVAPDRAPPSLVIVIDEFATLAKEVPDFVTGVVDVAQRGRSLGVHLILATQRPGGVVSENIRANTNLRIALRVNEPAESIDVIGVPDAASIVRSRPGRAFARTGHNELTAFQTGYVGGTSAVAAATEVSVRAFALDGTNRAAATPSPGGESHTGPTVLERIVVGCAEASQALGLPAPRQPWLPALPTTVSLTELPQPSTPVAVALGLVDEPTLQQQRPYVLDLDAAGSVLVYGAGGSGKTTLLRTLGCALAERTPVAELHLYGLDFASRGLATLEALPHCGSVVPGDDAERVERLIGMLRRTVERRKEQLAGAGVFSVEEFRRARPAEPMPRIVVLLDGYAGFASAFERVSMGALLETVPRLVADGRPLGVHFAITGDRRGAIPNTLATIVPAKIVLRMANDDEYASLGLDSRATRGTKLPSGRGFVDGALELQTAVVGSDPAPEAQAIAISRLGEELRQRERGVTAPPVQPLPAVVARATMPPAAGPLEPPLGIADTELEPVAVDLSTRHFFVVGPYRSGRSTTLRTIAEGLRAADPRRELHLLAPRRSALPELPIWTSAAQGLDACVTAVAELLARVEAGATGIVLVVDDGEELTDTPAGPAIETIVRRGRDVDVRVVAAAERQGARAFSGWPRELRKEEHGLLLDPELDVDGDLFGVRLPRSTSGTFPPGRGFYVSRGEIELVQVATD